MSRYSVSILFCLFICSGLWAAVKADDDALLSAGGPEGADAEFPAAHQSFRRI